MIDVKWAGIDFGQCMMDTRKMRTYLVIGDACKQMGESDLIDVRIHKFRLLKEKYGSYSTVKRAHRDEIISYVFDDRPDAREVLSWVEQEHICMANGLEDALAYLCDQGIKLSVVSELKKTLGPMGTDVVSRFLERHNLTGYVRDVICPQGRFDVISGSVDLKYKGKTKEEGTIYDELARDLKNEGIAVSEAVMIGDTLWTDISPAKMRGFRTIQYTGYTDMGYCEDADFRISDFRQLKKIVVKKAKE